jgi:hypothetical protein
MAVVVVIIIEAPFFNNYTTAKGCCWSNLFDESNKRGWFLKLTEMYHRHNPALRECTKLPLIIYLYKCELY